MLIRALNLFEHLNLTTLLGDNIKSSPVASMPFMISSNNSTYFDDCFGLHPFSVDTVSMMPALVRVMVRPLSNVHVVLSDWIVKEKMQV